MASKQNSTTLESFIVNPAQGASAQTRLNDTDLVNQNPTYRHGNIQAFRIGCFQFQLRLHDAIELPAYKGASFHGALGQALANISTGLRDYFYNPAPPFSLFMNRLLGRINALATLYGNGIVITPDDKQWLLNLADTVQIEHCTE